MSDVEDQVRRALAANAAEEGRTPLLCDFSVAEQQAAAEAQGAPPPGGAAANAGPPKLPDSLTLVVACVLLNSEDEVLMVQEAKSACAGKWYLPAGRANPHETLHQAAERELLEETGLTAHLHTLLAVESAAGRWFRYVFTGEVTGGELKTPARADAESLQAKWVPQPEQLPLRANDLLPLVERARARRCAPSWHPDLLPAARPHSLNLLRIVGLIKRRSTNRVHLLLAEKTTLHLPTVEIHPTRNLHSTLRKFLVEIFGPDLPQHRPHGLLSVEHSAGVSDDDVTDGSCLTLLVAFRPPLEEAPIIGKYVWHEIDKDLGDQLLARVSSKNDTLLLHVVR
ncbi:8-oxo-dGDP phosphatase NUDT18 [Arctopsyche grandis]|uniref:8-oxo-dGDP phosphatase NUDT18 n=1 Tax=Arctopsyche grandis TaxID=121162 RepID=UPI00406D65B8